MSDFQVLIPKLGESIQEATITKLFVKQGDTVTEDEILFEIATDKVDSEIPSPVAGIIKEIKKIIYFILQTFFPNLPKWVWELILLIDQIINDILGGGIIKIKNALSEAEINYLAELKGLVQLQIATRDLGDTQDDE